MPQLQYVSVMGYSGDRLPFVLIVNSIGHKFLHIAPLETKQTPNVEIVYTFKFYEYVAVHSWNKI